MTLSIRPEAVEAAAKAITAYRFANGGSTGVGGPHAEELAHAVLDAFCKAEGLTEERRQCGCDEGKIEAGPSGATYSVIHDRCAGYGRIERTVGPWRPVVEQEEGK